MIICADTNGKPIGKLHNQGTLGGRQFAAGDVFMIRTEIAPSTPTHKTYKDRFGIQVNEGAHTLPVKMLRWNCKLDANYLHNFGLMSYSNVANSETLFKVLRSTGEFADVPECDDIRVVAERHYDTLDLTIRAMLPALELNTEMQEILFDMDDYEPL